MSWAKRRGQPIQNTEATAPQVQMYNPNQHSNNQENHWQQQQQQQQQNLQAHNNSNWYDQAKQESQNQAQPQNCWQQPYNNQTQQQQFNQNSQQHDQYQTGFYQDNSATNQGYGNSLYNQQYGTQNTLYQAQGQTEADTWNSGWGDNWEDNSNTLPHEPQIDIADSFSKDKSWDWPVDNAAASTENPQQQQPVNNELFPKLGKPLNKFSIKTDLMGDADRLQPLDSLTGKRGKLERPQWSMESQMSQESSDDILQTSESDKSHMLSRSSTISHSPISGVQDFGGQNLDDVQIKEEANSISNKEVVQLPNPTPPPPIHNTKTPPLLPLQGSDDAKSNPFKSNSRMQHHKYRFENNDGNHRNVYHQNLEAPPDNSEQPDSLLPQLHTIQPSRKVSSGGNELPPQQQWAAENNEAPINDRNQYLETGHLSNVDQNVFNQVNDGIAQESDALPPPGLRRLVLGQLEQSESNSGFDNFGDEPAPGFSRMVPGQFESNSSTGAAKLKTDTLRHSMEPPEVLHRMIPGESSSPEAPLRQQQLYQLDQHGDRRQDDDDSETEFNIGVHSAQQPRSATIGADTPPAVSNPNLIGTKTNRSETIGADTSPDPSSKTSQHQSHTRRNRGTSGSSGENRRSTSGGNTASSVDKQNKQVVRKTIKGNRRNSIEGHIQDRDESHLTSSFRNLTVDNPSDDNDLSELNVKRRSKHGSSDSEHGVRNKSPQDHRSGRRYHDKDGAERIRHKPPEGFRDKKYDRRRHRDQKYEEDTDYYSDREQDSRKVKDDKERDRRYNSLRKEKEKNRKRRDYERDPRRSEYHYERCDEFDKESKSRASSRSDSLRESYRDRDRGHHDRSRGHHEKEHRDRRYREKERYRRHNEPFNLYAQGYGYEMYSQYVQYQQYYENLRKTDPQAYAKFYRKFYSDANSEALSFYGMEDRASVHSGRSSANDELAKDSFSRVMDQTDNSTNYEDHLNVQRLTPAKFATAHIKASISSGKLVKVLPHYPLDGQTPIVELSNLESLLCNDEEYNELKRFPGPLVKGVTHKKTIIEYCENKIKSASYNIDIVDPESYILMWELLILLIRQNGMVVGTDIAELLLKNHNVEPQQRSSSAVSSVNNNLTEGSSENSQPTPETNNGIIGATHLKEEEITNKFREYLLYGSGKEALEWAMKHGLWGHALFLASKLDKRTYANVMMRFANGLTMNDPLQTLYQLLSGRIPAAVTCISDEKWGDWRPHLAMILSNTSQRPEMNCKAITIMGDTLLNRGSLYSAQFCYLMAEVGFSSYESDNAKLVLLGSNHNKPFSQFATNEAIHMTEIYEFACSLNDSNFILPEFQLYKYLLSVRLADVGFLEKSLSYLERISLNMVKNPSIVQLDLVSNVITLADRLKYYDPLGDVDDEAELEVDLNTTRPDNSWLKDLRKVLNDCDRGLAVNKLEEMPNNYSNLNNTDQQMYNRQEPSWQPSYQQQWNAENDGTKQTQIEYQQPQLHQDYSSLQYQDHQQQLWSTQQQWNDDKIASYNNEPLESQQQNYYGTIAQNEEIPQPQISMPNQQKGTSPYDDEPISHEPQPKKDLPPAKPTKGQELSQEKASSNGWFGGIFSKLSLKPKNQMKLPDDKNPSIVWDPEKKRWINTDEDNVEGANELKPPPKMSDIMPKVQPPQPVQPGIYSYNPMTVADAQHPNSGKAPDGGIQQPTEASQENFSKPLQTNMFKLQKSRNLKKSYIDVFNANGKPAAANQVSPSLPASTSLGNMQMAQAQMNFFIPQPVNDPKAPTDFLTPAPTMQYNENSQMSRWSSASSLSREVQSYTQHKARLRR